MTDQDTVTRFHQIVAAGHVHEKKRYEYDYAFNRKRSWSWITSKRSDIRKVLGLFAPFLGERRTAKMNETLAWMDALDNRPRKKRSDAGKPRGHRTPIVATRDGRHILSCGHSVPITDRCGTERRECYECVSSSTLTVIA